MTTAADFKKARTGMDDSSDTTFLLISLPSSVLLVGVCAFLPLEDIFKLRLAGPRILAMLHGEGQDDLWKLVLQRDFGFSAKDLQDRLVETIIYRGTGESALAPARNMLERAESHFDAIKKWRRVSSWFYHGWESLDVVSNDNLNTQQQRGDMTAAVIAIAAKRHPHVHAPYFLRAARFWQAVVRWCENGPRVQSTEASVEAQEASRVRQIVLGSLSREGIRYVEYPENCRDKPGLIARQAVAAFCSGTSIQSYSRKLRDMVVLAILGGFEAYGYFCLNGLFSPSVQRVNRVALSFGDEGSSDHGCLVVDLNSGELSFDGIAAFKPLRSANPDRQDQLLLWLEEYARRLTDGEINVGIFGNHPLSPKGITLYPRYTPEAHLKLVNGVPLVSRRVTRGVEVIASAVFDPRRQHDVGFIYSIRIRLLTPDDGHEYVPSEDRGFVTCQLLQRHWRITDDETGSTQIVDGDGVIGMTPVLREYGYMEDGEYLQGTFQYQSCTGPMKRGSFGGHLTFNSSPENATPSYFDVEVGSFALESQPEFLF